MVYVAGFSRSLEIGSGGVGITIGEPAQLPNDFFDSGIDKYLPEQVPPPYVPMDNWQDFTVPQQSILGAFGSGLLTGTKANVNAFASAAVESATFGMWGDIEIIPVTDLDRSYGYETARAIAGVSTDILGLATGGGAAKAAGKANKVGKEVRKHADDIALHCKKTKDKLPVGCFTEGTQIVVGAEYDDDGNFVCYVTMNIEDVQVGDLVYSYDTVTGEVSQKEVTKTVSLQSDHINYLTIVDEHGHEQVIESTDVHPFWVVTDEPDLDRAAREVVDENGALLYHENLEPGLNGFWVEAKDLRVGDVFLGANGELSTLTNIVRIEQDGGIAVFNFSVEGNHNYFILAKEYDSGQTCVLVHNVNCGPKFKKVTPEELCDMTNTNPKKFHQDLKKPILKDANDIPEIKKELKKIGDNPDIWLDPEGTIGLVKANKGVADGSVVTPLKIEWYIN
jgi:hypothetical protein